MEHRTVSDNGLSHLYGQFDPVYAFAWPTLSYKAELLPIDGMQG